MTFTWPLRSHDLETWSCRRLFWCPRKWGRKTHQPAVLATDGSLLFPAQGSRSCRL